MLAAHVAFGLHYLHNLSGVHAPIVHGDLKPQNVLLNKKPLQVRLLSAVGLNQTLK
jgi:serine/threonine protein kinase